MLTTLYRERRGEAEQVLTASRGIYRKRKLVALKQKVKHSRFLAIYNEYKTAKAKLHKKECTLETMEKVLADIDKVIIDEKSGSGVVPYLPLPELKDLRTN